MLIVAVTHYTIMFTTGCGPLNTYVNYDHDLLYNYVIYVCDPIYKYNSFSHDTLYSIWIIVKTHYEVMNTIAVPRHIVMEAVTVPRHTVM